MRCGFSLAGLVGIVALLAGCGSGQPTQTGSLPPALLPNYGLGDAYHFTDDSAATVVAVDGNLVHWHGDGGTFVTSRDVLLPRLAWSNASEEGERRIGAGPVLLFPLETGKVVKFIATRSVHSSSGGVESIVQEHWSCAVAGVETLATSAGNLGTWRVDCVMQEDPPVTGDGVIRRSFYYAPAIGYYARIEEQVGDGPVHVATLSSYTTANPALAVTALQQRSAALQQAMEHEVSGSRTTWSDPTSGSAGDIMLIDTKRSARYGWCRDFTEHIQWAGRTYLLHGTGCRDPAKVWDIVALEPGKIGTD